ncbi:MAG TPA: ABC transporter permease [Solirubrobacteraceae bacterium]|jgi:ABC-2 type transport system permease protein|nr:ABC transporter permease [Solirubrobacteraceae bacterium]
MFLLIKYLMRAWRQRQAQRAVATVPGARATATSAGVGVGVGAGTATAPIEAARADGPSAASRSPLALLGHQAAYDLRISVRNPRARFMGFLFPIILLVVFNGVFGNGHTRVDGVRVTLEVFYVPGILAMSIVVNAYAGLVISISTLRESGVLKRRRAAPVPAAILVGGQAIATVAACAMTATILLVIAKLLYGFGMSGPAIAAVACTALIGTLAFACIGYAVSGMIGSPDAAQPVVQMTMLPLWFISGVFIPVASLSRGLKDVAEVFPVQHLANSLHLASVHSSFAGALSGTDLIVLAAWGLGAAAFAAWRFSWLPSAASA